jgi:signal transduction histidine kinase
MPALERRPSKPPREGPPDLSEEDVRKRLERLAALGARSAEVAHELRNALSVLETSLHLARRAAKGSDVAAKLEAHFARMAEQVHAGHTIVREVLDEGREALEIAPVDLRALVLETVAGLHRPEHVDVAVEITRMRVSVDERQIRQLLLNLARNAIEAMTTPRATPRPGRVLILAHVDDRNQLHLCVDDDGPGIDAAVAKRLFQPFVTGKRGGTGLGLALCKRIAEAHGGTIEASPRSPRGTRMEVVVPLPGSMRPPSEGKLRRAP